MRDLSDYEYDVFLSWTGADKDLKNALQRHLERDLGLHCYDSDTYCNGRFRSNYCEALDKSRVYLMILSDNLRHNPNISGEGFFTEVRREGNLACELEARGDLNIMILCLSNFFKYSSGYHDYNDEIGWHFYTITRGLSRIDATLSEDGLLSEATLNAVSSGALDFVRRRNAGRPAISQRPKIEISTENISENQYFLGRENEVKEIDNAFTCGAKIVSLYGMRGIGKAAISREFVKHSNQKGMYRCPQIAHIKNNSNIEDSDLSSLISAVNYEKSLYHELPSLCEDDRYIRKLKALQELPEYYMLVVNNYNGMTSEILRELTEKLNCRILITTNKSIDNVPPHLVKQIRIGRLDEDTSREMFEKLSSRAVEREPFSKLYNRVGGHTMTLCLMARTMLRHKIDIEALLCRMNNLSGMTEKIDFSHNSTSRNDTIMGHLEALYGMESFSPSATRILTNMALLSDGRISERMLRNYLELDTRNEINELVDAGWLVAEEDDRGNPILVLHPLLSDIVNAKLKPTGENASEIVSYLIDDMEAEESVTYMGAGAAADRLFFALLRVTQNAHALHHELWQLFSHYSHIVNDADEVFERCRELSSALLDDNDRRAIEAYSNALILAHHPTKIDVLNDYLNSLRHNSNNYREVLSTLTLVIPHIARKSEHHAKLREVIYRALCSAAAADDDFAFMELANVAILFSGGKRGKDISLIKNHIKQRKREKTQSGYIMYVDLMLSSAKMMGLSVKNPEGKRPGALAEFFSNKFIRAVKMALMHPICFIKSTAITTKIQLNPDLDEMTAILSLIFASAESVVDRGVVGVEELFRACLGFYELRVKNKLMISDSNGFVGMFLAIMQNLPPFMQGELRRLAATPILNFDELSTSDVAKLQTSLEINLRLHDASAVEQARLLLSAERHLHSDEHVAVVNAKLRLASTYALFGRNDEAVELLLNVYDIMRENSVDSDRIGVVCSKIMEYSYTIRNIPEDKFYAIYKTALSEPEITISEQAIIRSRAINSVRHRASLSDELFENVITDSIIWLDTIPAKRLAHMDIYYTLMNMFGNEAVFAYNNSKEKVKIAEALRLGLHAISARMPSQKRRETGMFLNYVEAKRAQFGSPEQLSLLREVVAVGAKHRINPLYATSNAMCDIIYCAAYKMKKTRSFSVLFSDIFSENTDATLENSRSLEQWLMSLEVMNRYVEHVMLHNQGVECTPEVDYNIRANKIADLLLSEILQHFGRGIFEPGVNVKFTDYNDYACRALNYLASLLLLRLDEEEQNNWRRVKK